MAAQIFKFDEFAGSGRGLFARPVLPNNVVALREHIDAISYAVNDVAVPGTIVSGSLDVDTVMLTELAPWEDEKDEVGYSFLWVAPGSLWPTAGKKYRIVVTFTCNDDLDNVQFMEVWEVSTKNPKQG